MWIIVVRGAIVEWIVDVDAGGVEEGVGGGEEGAETSGCFFGLPGAFVGSVVGVVVVHLVLL